MHKGCFPYALRPQDDDFSFEAVGHSGCDFRVNYSAGFVVSGGFCIPESKGVYVYTGNWWP